MAFAGMLSLGLAACSESSDVASSGPVDEGATTFGAVKTDQAKADDKEAKHEKTRLVKEKHEAKLLGKKGVNGVGVGQNEDGSPNIVVFTKDNNATDIPAELEGHKVKRVAIGEIKALGFTGKYSPVPIGVSVGNQNEGSSGTVGAVVTKNGYRYILSNNHVLARSNAARVGEAIVQPGRADAYAPARVATLSAYRTITFGNTNNIMDAAIAQYSASNTSWAVNNYYRPSPYTRAAYVGMPVKKVGRTTGFTRGKIAATNVTVNVGYPGGTARFTNQIYVASTFIQAGDSGSLMVTESGNYPVGLNFAGGTNAGFANPIGPVLQYFGVKIASY